MSPSEPTSLLAALLSLIEAARPFTSPEVVDETTGTVPLMDALDEAIRRAEAAVEAGKVDF
jgi:2-methylisocitrate lyase-like PEP mutase family enzyme